MFVPLSDMEPAGGSPVEERTPKPHRLLSRFGSSPVGPVFVKKGPCAVISQLGLRIGQPSILVFVLSQKWFLHPPTHGKPDFGCDHFLGVGLWGLDFSENRLTSHESIGQVHFNEAMPSLTRGEKEEGSAVSATREWYEDRTRRELAGR